MKAATHIQAGNIFFLDGGGEMGRITRDFDWEATPMGKPETWPQSLRTTLSIILNSKFPMFLFWGPELICFYNDAYRPSLGNQGKHPAVGAKASDVWPEIWPDIKPIIDHVLSGGEANWSEDQLLPIYRNGKLEDVYWTFSYSPVKDETGKIAGVFVTCTETTEKMISMQHLKDNEEEMIFTIEAADIGTWNLNPLTNRFTGNNRLKSWFGVHPDEEIDLNAAINNICEEDRERVISAIRNSLKYDSGGHYDIEYSILHPVDATRRFVRAMGKSKFNKAQMPIRFSGIILDITEQKKDEIRKNDFIGMVSHELKTPLTSLSAIVQVLINKLRQSDDPFVPGALDKANAQVKKMSKMINGFLNISRLESGKILIEKQAFDLNELLREIITETTLTVYTHTLVFAPSSPIEIFADRNKIGSVIANLLSNAVKYSPKGKLIEINSQVTGKRVQVSIKDEGMGIKQADISHLFDRYYRVDNKHTQNIAGFGIGLYLSAEIVAHHGGRIWVESESGVGSTFFFELPLEE